MAREHDSDHTGLTTHTQYTTEPVQILF